VDHVTDLIITHVDVDGVCCAALAKRYLGTDPYVIFTGPRSLARHLGGVREGYERIIITDVSLNHDQAEAVNAELTRLISSGSKVIWVDHHDWDPEDAKSVASMCELTLEPSPSAASLFQKKYGPDDDVSRKIAEIGDDADTNTNSLEYTLAYKHGAWNFKDRLLLVNSLANGEFEGDFLARWKWEMEEEIRDADDLVSSLPLNVSKTGKRYAVLDVRGRRAPGTYAAKIAAEKMDLDFACVIYSCNSVSFYRGVRETNLLPLAIRHGGGGHPYACGANPKTGILERLACFLRRHYITKEIKQILAELDAI